jgi:uncharacterized protein (DUF1919 family)
MSKLTQLQLRKNLGLVNYPIHKKDLIKYAEESDVDEKILRAFKHLPFKNYHTSIDLLQTLREPNNLE